MREHCHFFCETCGEVTDIELPSKKALGGVALPNGFEVATFDLSLRGICPKCRVVPAFGRGAGERELTSASLQ
jgi:Fe2+ or Zn2+ uptake regulation protein